MIIAFFEVFQALAVADNNDSDDGRNVTLV